MKPPKFLIDMLGDRAKPFLESLDKESPMDNTIFIDKDGNQSTMKEFKTNVKKALKSK